MAEWSYTRICKKKHFAGDWHFLTMPVQHWPKHAKTLSGFVVFGHLFHVSFLTMISFAETSLTKKTVFVLYMLKKKCFHSLSLLRHLNLNLSRISRLRLCFCGSVALNHPSSDHFGLFWKHWTKLLSVEFSNGAQLICSAFHKKPAYPRDFH